jgi:hypothetical protein
VDQRIESFLGDVLALAGEEPDAVREGVRVALAKCEACRVGLAEAWCVGPSSGISRTIRAAPRRWAYSPVRAASMSLFFDRRDTHQISFQTIRSRCSNLMIDVSRTKWEDGAGRPSCSPRRGAAGRREHRQAAGVVAGGRPTSHKFRPPASSPGNHAGRRSSSKTGHRTVTSPISSGWSATSRGGILNAMYL